MAVYLIDAQTVLDLITPNEGSPGLGWVRDDPARVESIGLSTVTIGFVTSAIEHEPGLSPDQRHQLRIRLRRLVERLEATGGVYGVDPTTATTWGRLRHVTDASGRRAPTELALCIATALANDLTIVGYPSPHYPAHGVQHIDVTR